MCDGRAHAEQVTMGRRIHHSLSRKAKAVAKSVKHDSCNGKIRVKVKIYWCD